MMHNGIYRIIGIVAVASVTLLLVGNAILRHDGRGNFYVHQAAAFLQGRLDITDTVTQTDPPDPDIAIHNGRLYAVFPPFPAVLLTPFVAVFGLAGTKPSMVSLALTVLNIVMLMRILRKLDVPDGDSMWIAGGFFLGTGYLFSMLHSSGVWFFAHIVAVTGLLLAIHEALGRGRGLLVGFYLVTAFLSRQLAIYAVIFLAAVLWHNRSFTTRRLQWRSILGLGFALGIGIMAYLLFNWLRFGNMLDTGYAYLPLQDFLKERAAHFGLFHPAYIPFNFIYMFLQGPHVEFGAPTFLAPAGVDLFGTAITFASPFVFIALAARWEKGLIPAAWVSIFLCLAHMLLYYNNGFKQVNVQRFTLDFLPVLIVLVGLGARRVPPAVWKGAIAYSVLLNAVMMFFFYQHFSLAR